MRATAFNQQVAQVLGISVKKTCSRLAWAISAHGVAVVAACGRRRPNGVIPRGSLLWHQVFRPRSLGGLLDSIGGAVVGAAIIIGVAEESASMFDSEYRTGATSMRVAAFTC